MEKVQVNYAIDHLGVPALLTAEKLLSSWRKSLSGFQFTQHQLANFQIEEQTLEAKVQCYGTITHYLPHSKGNTWRVVGNYEFQLFKDLEEWKIEAITFFFKYQDGNLELPKVSSYSSQ